MDNQINPNQHQEINTHSFWQHFSPRTLLLIIVLVLITGGLLYLALRQESPTTKITSAPTPTPLPAHATMMLTQESSTSTTQTVDVIVNSNENKLTGAQLDMSYDPSILSNVLIRQGNYFANPSVLFNSIDKKNGRISYVIAIGPTSQQSSGSGIVATISYTLLHTASKTTKLSFLPKTEVTQQGILGSVLKSATNLTITVPQSLLLSPSPTK